MPEMAITVQGQQLGTESGDVITQGAAIGYNLGI